MMIFTFDRSIPLEGGEFVTKFDVQAESLKEATEKSVHLIDKNWPEWLLKEDLIGHVTVNLVGVHIENGRKTA
jgi:hypothetical protein